MKALYFENKIAQVAMLKAASQFNKYAALGRLSPLKYKHIEEPTIPDANWVKVKNRSCGLCGTDLHFMFMDIDPRCFPAAVPGISRKFLGHELVGEIVEVGSDVPDFEVGDRVAMRIDWPSCFQMEIRPPCPQCAVGNYMLCENQGARQLPVRDVGGGFSPFMIMHRTQPFLIPDALSHDQALLLEPLASAVHGVLKASPAPGEKVLVIGAGSIGLLTVAVLRALHPEVEVFCLSRYPFQARVATKLGAEVIPEGQNLYRTIAEITDARYVQGHFSNEIMLGGFDVVYDSIGNDKSIHNALRWTRGGGTVVIIGINFNPGKVDYSPIWAQEINLFGINSHANESGGRSSFDIAAQLLVDDCVSPADLITHRFPIRQYKNAVKTFLSKACSEAIKIVLDLEYSSASDPMIV